MTRRTLTILLADSVASTELFPNLGEPRAERSRSAHLATMREQLAHHRGLEVKSLGDGLMVSFEAARDAIDAATAMQRVSTRAHRRELSIRIGVSSGDVWIDDEDCTGEAVVEASRLCALARGGQVLLADGTRLLAGGGLPLRDLGEHQLKGLPQPTTVWEATWSVDIPARVRAVLADDAVLMREGIAQVLERAVSAFQNEDIPREERLRWLWLACHAAGLLWDDESWDVLSAGKLARTAPLVEEPAAVNEATGSSCTPRSPSQLIVAATTEVVDEGEGEGLSSDWAAAVRLNGLGRYDEALAAAQRAADDANATWSRNGGLVELIEAAARSGKAEIGTVALGRLAQTTAAGGTDRALGVEARARALLSDDQAADGLYREAIERFARTRARVELARTQLLYGEWLRRERRRLDAREQLRHAHTLFTEFGMQAFAERARVELAATGEQARKRTTETIDQLTPQELQIAQMASDGLTNPEIGARLFISRRTVKYHLQKVFRKLEIRSRCELARVLLPLTPGD